MTSSLPSASVAVDKATSDLLIGPDWTMNIDICDSVNSNHWQAKDVVKAVKRRLQNKHSHVQLLALTLLETMVKNCGDHVHFQIAEKNILGDMVKIVRKKQDMRVRDKILALLDSWQEAFGGPGQKYPQYYWAYDELRRSGIEFPRRSPDAAPIFTPPASHPASRFSQAGYGMPSGSSRRLDETMATENESLNLSSLESMRNVMELLNDMLQAVNPRDSVAVKDEVIVDLVNQCRSNQKKLMQMLTTTGDEELLASGLELNDSLQNLLAKHDAIASGTSLPTPASNLSSKPVELSSDNFKPTEVIDSSPGPSVTPPAPPVATASRIDDEEEEEDDFAQLARRHTKKQPIPSEIKSAESSESNVVRESNATSLFPDPGNALVLSDPPPPVKTTKEQDMIDLLTITLYDNPESQSASNQNEHGSPKVQGHPQNPQSYPVNQDQVPSNGYVVPWAQPHNQSQADIHTQSQSQQRPQSQPRPQIHQHSQPQSQSPPQSQWPSQPQQQSQWPSQPQQQSQWPSQPQQQSQWPSQPQQQSQWQSQPQQQSQWQSQVQQHYRPQYPQYSPAYPPPPWMAGSDISYGQGNTGTGSNNMFWTPRADTAPLQHYNSVPTRESNGTAIGGDSQYVPAGPKAPATVSGQKPFIPSYRLFEDLNVLGNGDGKNKVNSGTSPGQSMIGGRK